MLTRAAFGGPVSFCTSPLRHIVLATFDSASLERGHGRTLPNDASGYGRS